ncbi:MAG: methylmalonyl Co-A mutase-associated GTPase MeaB [Acidobacteriia bacterium]|nr:methylmalonyl Co-A mutase-associated GTPase MeaB [Terriglobia bacterium]
MKSETPEILAQQIRAGSSRALSRGLTWVEQGGPRAEELCGLLYPCTGRAQIIGITGSPGTGKSTLTRRLALAAAKRNLRTGIIAVDPSSPYSGGSILGDRIRMNDLSSELGIFIRSMASHGALGGLCRAAEDSADLMDAAGMDLVFMETVGVGQDEVDVMGLAHTVVVVTVPGLGDDVQTLKAGILEIAHVHAVNKSDRPGADQSVADLLAMLNLGPAGRSGWTPPVLSCTAATGEGVEALLDSVLGHMSALKESNGLQRRQLEIAKARVSRIVREGLERMIEEPACGTAQMIDQIARREVSPYKYVKALTSELAQFIETNKNA